MKWWRRGEKGAAYDANNKNREGSKHERKDPSNLSKYDCYSILGITHNATEEEIKRAYRRLALQYHPDRNKSPEATAIFTVIQMAYDTLVDSDKRRRYDSSIPALPSTQQTTIKVVLEGAFTKGYAMDDHAAISLKDSDEAISYLKTALPFQRYGCVYSNGEQKQYLICTDVAFDRLFRAIYKLIDPKEKLDDLEVIGTPELRAPFDARFWSRGQTNVSLYYYSSMSLIIIDGIPFLYLNGAKYYNVSQEITLQFYTKLQDTIKNIIYAELGAEE